MAEVPLIVKHAGKKYEVAADLSQPGEVFKVMLYSLTSVEPERQKILVKGGQLKDDADMSKLGLKPGQTIMMMGTPSDKALQAPKGKTKFVEDMTEAELAQREGAIPAGLQNLGNTCYMNSTLQTLRYIPELQQELQKYKSSGSSSAGGASFGGLAQSSLLASLGGSADLTEALKTLYKGLGETTEGYSPQGFLQTLRQAYPQFAQQGKDGRYAQQDAEECYSQIVTQLRNKLKIEGEDRSFVDKYMAGKMLSTVTCAEDAPDEMPVETTETFTDLKCHITIKTNFLREGILEGLSGKIEKQSPTLGRQAVYEEVSRVTRLPKYLTCHFVRFYWKQEIKKKAKIMRKVAFPFDLDATEFCSEDLRKKLIPVRDRLRNLHKDAVDRERARKRMKLNRHDPDDVAGGNAGQGGFGSNDSKKSNTADQVQQAKEEQEAALKKLAEEKEPDWAEELEGVLDPELAKDDGCNPSGLYELIGVVTHQGASADSGHYCAYVKKEGGDGKTWYFFNDDVVTEVDQSKVETLAGGGESHSALILLYCALPLTPPASAKQ